jgi:DNA modification methylase
LNRILVGDALEQLRTLPDECVQCVVTSPPYWGLRDYGVAGQIGLETSPAEYIGRMVEVFREVRRVLRDDGTIWVNMGDCYATGAGAVGDCPGGGEQGERWKERGPCRKQVPDRKNPNAGVPTYQPNRMPIEGLKPKDLVGMPWRLAFALQADGWYLRSDNIWHKPNPMPESVTDRPTKAHEYVFLLSKSERYFYDAEAIKEPQEEGERTTRLRQMARGLTSKPYTIARDVLQTQPPQGKTGAARNLEARYRLALLGTRNRRTVWTITTKPFPEAHFATFPEEIPAICIGAGTSERGACSHCGAPLSRVLEVSKGRPERGTGKGNPGIDEAAQRTKRLNGQELADWKAENPNRTVGWVPTCKHSAGVGRCVVLDPFMGAGTTALVALKAGRDFIGVELNPEYAQLARERIESELVQGRLA